VSQRTHISVQHHVNKEKISRNLHLAGCIPTIISILPLTHIENDVLECEHGGALKPGDVRLGRLMAALQHSRYIGYGQLHFSSVNGREKYIWLATVNPQMSVKFSDQSLVCSGGDGFEKPLQILALQFLYRPTCGFVVGELLFDGKGVLQQELSTLHRRPGYNSMGPRRLGRRTSPSRHAGGSLGQSVKHLVCNPKSKG
jgi:hypothetical protein